MNTLWNKPERGQMKLTLQQKYRYYEDSVQSPEAEIKLMQKIFRKRFKRSAEVLREDFGGTGFISCEWVKQSSKHRAFAVDLDPEPIAYGLHAHWEKLTHAQQKRMIYLNQDVLKCRAEKPDVVGVFNFSFWFFKTRADLLRYFISVRKSLRKEGLLLLDTLGGTAAVDLVHEKRNYRRFTYYWECTHFNPIDHHCRFAIHLKPKGQKVQKDVFVYDWRYWSIPEVVDILYDAGFSKVEIYWEGDNERTGEGNGVFSPTQAAEHCYSWIAYLAAFP